MILNNNNNINENNIKFINKDNNSLNIKNNINSDSP